MSVLELPLPLSLIRTRVTAFRAHLDHPGETSSLKIPDFITSFVTLGDIHQSWAFGHGHTFVVGGATIE